MAFLTPRKLREHQEDKLKTLLEEAVRNVEKTMLDTTEQNGKRYFRIHSRYVPVMERVASLLEKSGWSVEWKIMYSARTEQGQSEQIGIEIMIMEEKCVQHPDCSTTK